MNDNILVNKNVLVAEDNAINQMVVKHALLEMGANADIASDGAEAIEKFKKNKYDLILMDIQMPLMDGYEATAYIRNELASNVPIIAMTAFALKGEDEKCFECGMNNYIAKPFTVENLSAVIKNVISLPSAVVTNPYIFTNKNVSVDLSLLYDISGDDESYIGIMLQTFLENMPNTVRRIEKALAEQDWEELYSAAHYAKSSLSVIKVSEMLEAVITVEGEAKKKINFDILPALVKKIKETFSIAEEIISKKIAGDLSQSTNKSV